MNAPVLDRLSVLEAEDVDVIVGERAVRRREPHDLAGVPTRVGEVDDDGVSLLDRSADVEALVGESGVEESHRLAHALDSLGLARSGGVIDAIGSDDVRDGI